MTRILEIDVEAIEPAAVAAYDKIAMVDTQPSFFEEALEEIDLVIGPENPSLGGVHVKDCTIRELIGSSLADCWAVPTLGKYPSLRGTTRSSDHYQWSFVAASLAAGPRSDPLAPRPTYVYS